MEDMNEGSITLFPPCVWMMWFTFDAEVDNIHCGSIYIPAYFISHTALEKWKAMHRENRAYLIRSANVRDEVLKMTQEVVLWFYLYGYVGMMVCFVTINLYYELNRQSLCCVASSRKRRQGVGLLQGDSLEKSCHGGHQIVGRIWIF